MSQHYVAREFESLTDAQRQYELAIKRTEENSYGVSFFMSVIEPINTPLVTVIGERKAAVDEAARYLGGKPTEMPANEVRAMFKRREIVTADEGPGKTIREPHAPSYLNDDGTLEERK